ncbi:MAG: carboxypeptidase regulatory-like domain-containing protein [Natronohydrobacter sp.]|nr:carboxypeptidase regulatory-like domain-containing protein [Natronohydrobacter sp.]
MSRRSRLAGLVICAAGLFAPLAAFSHAALIEAETAQAIRLHAFYDTGAPMSHAQVIIYAPDDAATPWGQGVTDREGRLEFVLGSEPGRWSFQVRQSGHGAMVHVEVGTDAPVVMATAGAQGWGQRLLMVALVAWGALGTAAFAYSRKGARNASA